MESAVKLLMNSAASLMERHEGGEDEYTGSDGLRHCARCGKPLEYRRAVPFMGVRLLPILCDCGKKRRELDREQDRLALERKHLSELTGLSLMDERARTSTFDNARETAENARALRVARRYVRHWPEMLEQSKGLLFYGPTGTGKTYLADCIANALKAQGVPVVVTSLLRVTADADALTRIIERMKAARLLVLDDLGTERDTSFKREQVFSVLDSRYASKRPLIVTTNLSLSEMKAGEVSAQRIFDRVLSMCYPVFVGGESWRWAEVREKYEDLRALLEGGEEA